MSTTSTSATLGPRAVVAGNGPNVSPAALTLTIPDDMLYEVVDARIVEKEMGARDVEIAGILFKNLDIFARTNRAGRALMEFIFRIDQVRDLQRRPAVAFVSHAKWPVQLRVPDVGVWDMVPDLAVEVVSPSNSADQVQEKTHEYFTAGVGVVWVIYPSQQEIYIYASPTQIQVLQLGQDLDGGNLVPGFRLPLAALFEDEALAPNEG